MIDHGDQLRLAYEASARLGTLLAEPPPEDDKGARAQWREQSLANGAAGLAVLHGVQARSDGSGLARAHAWLTRVAREDLSAGPGVGLWFGVPAVAFAVLTVGPHHYRRTAANLDAAVRQVTQSRLDAANARLAAGLRPLLAEFDLVHGLTGLGAYLLRRDSEGDLLPRVLTYLVRLTEPVDADDDAGPQAPGWWACDAPSPQREHQFRSGHANFGMAHGIAGPLALLSLAMRRGITVNGHVAAIEVVCDWLDTWRHETTAGPWWPEHIDITEFRHGRSHRMRSARPSWCYGTPGLARAQQLAGMALGDDIRRRTAERALDQCLADPTQLSRITDASLCHGWAGLTATAWFAAADAKTDLGRHLPHLIDTLLAYANEASTNTPGLIDGTAGVALTLHTVATGNSGAWPTCLLID